MRGVGWFLLPVSLIVGCTEGQSASDAVPGDASAQHADAQGLAEAGHEASADAVDADASVEDGGPSTGQGPADASEDASGSWVALPAGSRVYGEVLNLVDAHAAEQVELLLYDDGTLPEEERKGIVVATNLFLELYEEVYDFVYFVTERQLDEGAAGRLVAITKPAAEGQGGRSVRLEGFRTGGKLKGAAAIMNYDDPRSYGPFGHEAVHYWANHLDPELGFGSGGHWAHWGLSDVNGILGGFDGATLRCDTPAGALPPACSAEPNGRIRYRVAHFFGSGSSREEFGTLELYLMGLLPPERTRQTYQVLRGGEVVEWDAASETYLLEADALEEVTLDDIRERHGTVQPAEQTSFKAAFVVVSREPADDALLAKVDERAAIFGGRTVTPEWSSFETYARGLATMDTRLGPRRSIDDPVPEPRGPFHCDVIEQDCPGYSEGCYGFAQSVCAPSAGLGEGELCDPEQRTQCAPGLDCISNGVDPAVCTPYCDPENEGSPRACAVLCPGYFVQAMHEGLGRVQGLCVPSGD